MPILTEAELRERVRQPQDGMKLSLPRGTMFSPSAADFIKQWHIEVVFDGPGNGSPAALVPAQEGPDWDKASVFPVNFKGELPQCITCGTPLKKKPEHMTQLNAQYFAPKTHDRIRLRGRLDTLQAMCLLVAAMAREQAAGPTADLLDSLAAYCREMLSAEYNERPVAPLSIDGLDEAQLRETTHDPQAALGIPHLTPSSQDSLLLLWLNYLRCQVRETEIIAAECFRIEAGVPDVSGLVQALNRLSSAVYYLELIGTRA